MSNFPGEHTKIPKRLTEALALQPLNYLVPKRELSTLLSDQVTISLHADYNEFPEPPSELWHYSHPIDLNLSPVRDETDIKFKRPKSIKLVDEPEGSSENNLTFFKDLSLLAKRCLTVTSLVDSNTIIETNSEVSNPKKHDRDNVSSDVKMTKANKKNKTANYTAKILNQVSLGNIHIKELNHLMNHIGIDNNSVNLENIEYWITLSKDTHVLSVLCMEKLQISLKNLLEIKSIHNLIEVPVLKRLLDVFVNNIMESKKQIISCQDRETYERIGFGSIISIFIIFLLDLDLRGLYLDKYIMVPIDFVSFIVADYKDNKDNTMLTISLPLLHATLSWIAEFTNKKSTLDDQFLIKLVYIIGELLMANVFQNVKSSFLSQYESIKSICIQIFSSIFAKNSDQRIFIVDEILIQMDNLPSTRSQKKLKNIGHNVFVTHFTLVLISILQTINAYDYCIKIDEFNENIMKDLSIYYKDTQLELNFTIEHINDTILTKVFSNTALNKHIFDHFIQDLLIMITFPQWSVSEIVLSSLLKKLLLVFGPNQQVTTNVETIALQALGLIGSKILDIRLETRPEENNNLIQIFNYPIHLDNLMNSFKRTISVINKGEMSYFGSRFLWSKQIDTLLKLLEFGKESENWKCKIYEQICLIIKQIHIQPDIDISDLTETLKDYYSILFTSELINLYDPYVKLILSLLDRQKIKLRSGAIKCLSLLIKKDKDMLATPVVRETIENRLKDSSASVKDAILDLIELGDSLLQFYHQINFNYNDDSVSVRKHVLRINDRIYELTHIIEIKSYVSERILRRIEDEEDHIIEQAKSILLEKWIFSLEAIENNLEMFNLTSKEIIKVISRLLGSNEKSVQLFENFLMFYLINPQAHTPDKYNRILKYMHKLTNQIVELIIESESIDYTNSDIKNELPMENVLRLLSMISFCDENFITKNHIFTLYPYLFSNETSEFQYCILKIYNESFKRLSNFKPKFLYELETMLLTKLPKMNLKEIEETIQLSWSISNHRKNDSRISKACFSCLSQLMPYIIKARENSKLISLDGRLQRLLYLATGFARFCKFNNLEKKIPILKPKEHVYEYVAKCLLVFTKNDLNHVLRRISIKNLVKLSTSYPKLFNSPHILTLLDLEFKSNNLDIKLVIIEAFYDFFLDEEKKSIKQAGVNETVSSSVALKSRVLKFNKTESVNDGICSALISRYLTNILDICLLEDVSTSLVAIRFVKLVLEYGYTNPSLCIPTIIALTASQNCYIKKLALGLSQHIIEKYETMVLNGLPQGIKLATQYSRTIEPNLYFENNMFLKQLQDLLSSNKRNNTKFLKSVMNVFCKYCIQLSSLEPCISEDIMFLCYNMINISYETQFELYDFIRRIDIELGKGEIIIKENLKYTNDDKNYSILSAFIISHLAIEEFRRSIFLKYSLSEEKLLLIGTPEDLELKNKQLQLTEGNHALMRKDLIFYELNPSTQQKEICDLFITKTHFA